MPNQTCEFIGGPWDGGTLEITEPVRARMDVDCEEWRFTHCYTVAYDRERFIYRYRGCLSKPGMHSTPEEDPTYRQ